MRDKILAVLEKNSRIDLHELAILLGEDEAVIANEIQDMEKEHIICGYHTLINWDKTSEEKVTALIEVRVTPQRGKGYEALADRIVKYPEVNAVYLMAGAYDFTVILEGKTMRSVSRFVTEKLALLDEVISTATYYVLKKYKDHGIILADTEKEDERMKIVP
ncbi:MAG: Lrp/AsnC family transcriptional regulator [Lachnospiraceae bacterium]|nr:Lrp/AsnC family transcriptional regulator [Lachnospiraceae bacterium]